MNLYASAYLHDLLQYGPHYLSKEEFDSLLRKTLASYYEYLALNMIKSRGKEFWEYHRNRLDELGFPVTAWELVKAFLRKGLRIVTSSV